MKKFVLRATVTFSIMMTLMLVICDVVIGVRVVALLIKGIVNIALCLEFLGVTFGAAVFVALTSIVSDKIDNFSVSFIESSSVNPSIDGDDE